MKNTDTEIWLDVEPKGSYQVSNFGRVKSLDRLVECEGGRFENRKGCEMKLYLDDRKGAGYVYVSLKSFKKRVSVHKLVAEAFLPNLQNLPLVNHKDGNKKNNCVNNLEWCSVSQNIRHAHSLGLIHSPKSSSHSSARKIHQFNLDGSFIMTWNCITDAEKALNIDGSNISANANNKAKSAGGFIWKFKDEKVVKSLENLANEIWRDVVGFEGSYQVSNMGRFKSLNRTIARKDGSFLNCKGQILKNRQDGEYMSISFGQFKSSVHKCVAQAFLSNPNNLPMVNHKDGNKTNNEVSNLEWSSFSDNSKHAHSLNLVRTPKGKESVCAKKIDQFDLNGNFIKTWDCGADAHRFFTGNKKGNIYRNLSGEMNSAYGFIWKRHNYLQS
jgi:hypothetical protein